MVRHASLIVVSFAAVGMIVGSSATAIAKSTHHKKAARISKARVSKKPSATKKLRAAAGKSSQSSKHKRPRKRAQRSRLFGSSTGKPSPASSGKLDTLAAALAQAAGHGDALAKPTRGAASARRSTKPHGMAGLGDLSRSTAGLNLLAADRARAVPSGEMVEHMTAVTLSQRAITKVVKHNLRYLQYCHQNMVARKKAVYGDVSLEFVVEPRGSVSQVRAHASGKDAALLQDCLERRIAKWRFPAGDAPTRVQYPLVFDTAHSADDT